MRNLSEEDLKESIDTDLFHAISAVAGERGVKCYVIGGWVRDLYLGRPSGDIDILVERDAPEFAQAVKEKLGWKRSKVAIFRRFGTAQIRRGNVEIEFVGARKESYSSDSRKPEVTPASIVDDLKRRDFTVNTIAISLSPEDRGSLLDYFDGVGDLYDRIIRTPLPDADITFSDDPLRMMRCIRFATQLSFQIDYDTFDALTRNAERIKIVSPERISVELEKILAARCPSVGFVDLQRSGLLEYILPELSALDIRETKGGFSHKNNFYHSLEVLDNVARASDNIWLRWAALLHDIGKGPTRSWNPLTGWTFKNHNVVGARMVKRVFHRLRLPEDTRSKYVAHLVELHMRPIAIADDSVTDSAVRRLLADAGDDIDDLMTLCEADITSRNEKRKQGFLDNFKYVRRRLGEIEEKDRLRNFQPPVDGIEIMHVFGLRPCREVGVLKARVKDAVLDGIVPNSHDEALAWLVDEAAKLGISPVAGTADAAPAEKDGEQSAKESDSSNTIL